MICHIDSFEFMLFLPILFSQAVQFFISEYEVQVVAYVGCVLCTIQGVYDGINQI